MGEGVVADLVAGVAHGARDFWARRDVLPDHEEGRLHRVARQHFQQPRGVRVVGAVVVGEGEQLAAGRIAAADERRAVELRGGVHRGPTCAGGAGEQAGSAQQRGCHGFGPRTASPRLVTR